MNQPLELTIHPPLSSMVRAGVDHNIEQGLYPYLGFNAEIHVPGIIRMHIKRLAEAELAAEYWAQHHDAQHAMTCELAAGNETEQKACSDWMSSSIEKADAIRRFATSPHYFEADQ